MGACQNQFHNVPDVLQEDNENKQKEQIERYRQSQVIRSRSIRRQHKSVQPNSKQFNFGMIDRDRIKSQYLSQFERNSYQSKSAHINEQILEGDKKQKFDREQLHLTRRPFGQEEEIEINNDDEIFQKDSVRMRQQLDNLDFYYSLGLSEYTYQSIPPSYSQQYDNLQLNEQEERNGVKYVGQWKNDQIHGNGVLKSNTMKYIGQFRNGLKWFNGREIQKQEVYEGQFENGRRKGNGIRFTPDRIQEGIFDEHLIDGIITYKNKDVYTGTLKNKKYHGQGILREQQKGVVYQGNFKNGKLEGQGSIKFDDGKYYKGTFHDGQKHGDGYFYWDDQNIYDGEYLGGKKNGRGKLVRNGIVYLGQFEDGGIARLQQIKQARNNQSFSQIQSSSFIDNDGIPEHWKQIILKNDQF